MGPFIRSLDHAAQVVPSRTLPVPATPGRPHLYRGPPGRATAIPRLLLLFQGCYCYSRAATGIPGLLLVFQGCYWYSRAATGIPGLLLVFQGCYCYSRAATGIPGLLLVFQGCYWYSKAATVIPGLPLLFQGCYCYSRAATGIPGLLLVFQGCTLCLLGDTAPFFPVQAEGGGAVYSHHLLDCRRDGVYSFRLLDFSKPPHLSRPTMKVRFRIFFRAPFG